MIFCVINYTNFFQGGGWGQYILGRNAGDDGSDACTAYLIVCIIAFCCEMKRLI